MEIIVLFVLLIALIAVLSPQSGANQAPIAVYIGPQPPNDRASAALLVLLLALALVILPVLIPIVRG